MITFRNPATLHEPVGGYMHQAEIGHPARWLVIAGQVGKEKDGTVPEDPIDQILLALDNVGRNLEAAGMSKTDLVKLNWYLVGDIDPAKRVQAIEGWMKGHVPCSTALYVAALARPVYRVEVDALAAQAI